MDRRLGHDTKTGQRSQERKGTRVLGQDFGVGQLGSIAGTGQLEQDSQDRTATVRRGKKVQNSHMTTRTGQLNKTTEKKQQWQDGHDRTFGA